MTSEGAIIVATIKAHVQALFDAINAKVDRMQASVDAIACELQETHAIAVDLRSQELLKAKVVTAAAALEGTREERAERPTPLPPNGHGDE